MWIEGKLALGHLLVRTISTDPEVDLAAQLRASDFSVVKVPGRLDGDVDAEVLFVVERRRRMGALLSAIEAADGNAVTTVTDVKEHRLSPSAAPPARRGPWQRMRGAFK